MSRATWITALAVLTAFAASAVAAPPDAPAAERVLFDLDLNKDVRGREVPGVRVVGGQWDDGWRVTAHGQRVILDAGYPVKNGLLEVWFTKKGPAVNADGVKGQWLSLHEQDGGLGAEYVQLRAGLEAYGFSKLRAKSNEKAVSKKSGQLTHKRCEATAGTVDQWVTDDATVMRTAVRWKDAVVSVTTPNGDTVQGTTYWQFPPPYPIDALRYAYLGSDESEKGGSLPGLRFKRVRFVDLDGTHGGKAADEPAAAASAPPPPTTPLASAEGAPVPQRSVYEVRFEASGTYANPYAEVAADAVLTHADGDTRTVPLFWDGGKAWAFRFSPDRPGQWRWAVQSADAGLNGRSGTFQVVASDRKGSIVPMAGHPHHFQRQDNSPFWFLGDTAWALFTDIPEERHDGSAALRYVDQRASQGFNVLHSMLLSETGQGNNGGLPFTDLAAGQINPAYWQEVDRRLAHVNAKGLVAGLVLAWGDKRGVEPFAWRRFPSLEAKKRYARYVAARYAAHDVYFIVAGEWQAEARRTDGGEPAVRREFVAIGDALRAADAHHRMIGIHPMASHGSVREFAGAAGWMGFADYQQNYRQLHDRALVSRQLCRPVVNSEYAYHVRMSDKDNALNKPNSFSADDIRHASWDVVMAGGYLVSGFGTTYFGGQRTAGPFDLDSARDKDWAQQVQHLRAFFTADPWHTLIPADYLLTADLPRGKDRAERFPEPRRAGGTLQRPPVATYWAMMEPGRRYVVYARGMTGPVRLALDAPGGSFAARQFNPRTGEHKDLGRQTIRDGFEYAPPDEHDWVVVLRREE